MKPGWRRGRWVKGHVAIGAVLLFSCGTASASQILYNTGVDANGAFLPSGTVDPHWSLVTGDNAYVAYGATAIDASTKLLPIGWPIEDRYTSSSSAQWIAPAADITDLTGTTSYQYVTTFDLTGYDPSTASLVGRFSVDNSSGGMYLNGVLIPGTTSTDIYGYLGFIDFNITSGFVAGVNTLAFKVDNSPAFTMPGDPNPTGLLVEIDGDPVPNSVNTAPEPAAMWLSGGGLAILGLQRLLARRS